MVRKASWLLVALVVSVGLCATSFAATTDYSIKVVQQRVSPSLIKDVVLVRLADGTTPTLNDFMQKIVPAALQAGTGLPAPANTGTLMTDVVIPGAKTMYIQNANNLPVRLRVIASSAPGQPTKSVREDGHERFTGRGTDPGTTWTVKSYFVTEFTAVAKVTKYHTNKPFTYPVVKQATGRHQEFNWVDP